MPVWHVNFSEIIALNVEVFCSFGIRLDITNILVTENNALHRKRAYLRKIKFYFQARVMLKYFVTSPGTNQALHFPRKFESREIYVYFQMLRKMLRKNGGVHLQSSFCRKGSIPVGCISPAKCWVDCVSTFIPVEVRWLTKYWELTKEPWFSLE